jgi:hypothetical protein
MFFPQEQEDNVSTTHDEKYFADMLTRIRSDLLPRIPSIDSESYKLLHSSCSSVAAAQKSLDAAKIVQEKASTPQEQQAANDALQAAEEALTQAIQVAIQASTPVIMDLEETLLNIDTLDNLLCLGSVMVNATPKGLAAFCMQGETQQELVDDLLNNTHLMRDMLQAGGAKVWRSHANLHLHQYK